MLMKQEIRERIAALRSFMQSNGLSAFIVPSTDPHSGEYVPDHWESRKWISGFTGSAGTAVITTEKAGLWTDSRYFLQAADQLADTGINLFKDRLPETPSIPEWLGKVLKPGDKVGIDGWVNTTAEAESLNAKLSSYGLELISTADPFQSLWKDRPALPSDPPFILPLEYAGMTCKDKLKQIRERIRENGADGILISALDEIAWTLNLRGSDVHCNPVFVSFLLITGQHCTLYILPDKLTPEILSYLKENEIDTRPYETVENDLKSYPGSSIQLSASTNYALYQAAASNAQVIRADSPVLYMKAIKNETEIKGFREAMKRDGVAMVRFLIWLKETVKNGKETETSIDRKLYELRAEQKDFKGISFDTIAGYQEHGAIVHYEATEETASTLRPEGMLLLDSGAQYLDGTTDITRTIVLGAQRIHRTFHGRISVWHMRHAAGCPRPPVYVEGRNQLRAWNRTRSGALSECPRRTAPVPHEPHACAAASGHDRHQRTGNLSCRTSRRAYRKYDAYCQEQRNGIRRLLPL